MITNALGDFVDIIRDFVFSLLPSDLASAIIGVVVIIIALAAWRIIS